KRDLDKRAVCVIAGSRAASVRPACVISAIRGRICSPPCVPPPDRALRSSCRSYRLRPCRCSLTCSRQHPRLDEHAALVADQAGWHIAGALRFPDNVTLIYLPSYSPELNPVERVWLYLRERHLSHRLLDGYEDRRCAL